MPAERLWHSCALWPVARGLPDGCGRHLHRHAGGRRAAVGAGRGAGDGARRSRLLPRRETVAGAGRGAAARCGRHALCGGVAADRSVRAADEFGGWPALDHGPQRGGRALSPPHARGGGRLARVCGERRIHARAGAAYAARGHPAAAPGDRPRPGGSRLAAHRHRGRRYARCANAAPAEAVSAPAGPSGTDSRRALVRAAAARRRGSIAVPRRRAAEGERQTGGRRARRGAGLSRRKTRDRARATGCSRDRASNR